jgi:hypothetical protein
MNTSWSHILLLTAITAFAAACAPAADTPSRVSREEAIAAKQKAEAAITASQKAIDAATQANKPEIVEKARALLKRNQQKLAEAEVLLRSLPPPPDPLRDPLFIAAVLENARQEAQAAETAYDEALLNLLFSTGQPAADRAVDEAESRLQKAYQTMRDLRTRQHELRHPQLMADMQRLRQDRNLAAELDQVLKRIRQDELALFKLREEIGSDTGAVRHELKKLKDAGAFGDTADLLSRAQKDPRVRAALDRAHARIMHDQADILRDSTDKLWQEVQRLKQKLAQPAR